MCSYDGDASDNPTRLGHTDCWRNCYPDAHLHLAADGDATAHCDTHTFTHRDANSPADGDGNTQAADENTRADENADSHADGGRGEGPV
ncbi:MAG: hypothetical protein ACOYZ7_20950 [Chloroflexota bacterium]